MIDNEHWLDNILHPIPVGYKLLKPGTKIDDDNDIFYIPSFSRWMFIKGFIMIGEKVPDFDSGIRIARKIKND